MILLTEKYTSIQNARSNPFKGVVIVDFVQNPLVPGAVGKVLRLGLPFSIRDD
jgi:hypothetical protein